jgi:hypothetical protein
MLWFDVLTHRDEAGDLYCEVLDVLERPSLNERQILRFGHCRLDERRDTEIGAVADYTDEECHTHIAMAWRANRRTRRFEPIGTAGIFWENYGYQFGYQF